MLLDKEPHQGTSSQIVSSSFTCYRTGNIVTVCLNGEECQSDGLFSNVIPNGYKPLGETYGMGMIINATDGSRHPCYMAVQQNGGIAAVGLVNNTYSLFRGNVYASITYCV